MNPRQAVDTSATAHDTRMILRRNRIPATHRPPHGDTPDGRWRFWITAQENDSATDLYAVTADGRGEQHIVATDMYLSWAMIVVDALRASGPTTGPLPTAPPRPTT